MPKERYPRSISIFPGILVLHRCDHAVKLVATDWALHRRTVCCAEIPLGLDAVHWLLAVARTKSRRFPSKMISEKLKATSIAH